MVARGPRLWFYFCLPKIKFGEITEIAPRLVRIERLGLGAALMLTAQHVENGFFVLVERNQAGVQASVRNLLIKHYVPDCTCAPRFINAHGLNLARRSSSVAMFEGGGLRMRS